MATESVRRFYDELAPTYSTIFADWSASVDRQGAALDRLVRSALGPGSARVLDCAAGVGTQTLGLLQHGHRVVASDLSPRAIAHAAAQAARRGLGGFFLSADMRALPLARGWFDVVVCADNSLPHLLTEADLDRACREMARVTRPGGLLVVTTRDYDALLTARPATTAPSVCETPQGRVITFQLWHWRQDDRYDLELFQLFEDGAQWRVEQHRAPYWAMTRSTVERALHRSGWADARWWPPEESGFYQPLVTARR